MARHDLLEANEDRRERAYALLVDQKARLELVVEENAFPCTTAEARSLLRRIDHRLSLHPEAMALTLGEAGPNGWGPRVDLICETVARHSRMNASAVARGETPSWIAHWRPSAILDLERGL